MKKVVFGQMGAFCGQLIENSNNPEMVANLQVKIEETYKKLTNTQFMKGWQKKQLKKHFKVLLAKKLEEKEQQKKQKKMKRKELLKMQAKSRKIPPFEGYPPEMHQLLEDY